MMNNAPLTPQFVEPRPAPPAAPPDVVDPYPHHPPCADVHCDLCNARDNLVPLDASPQHDRPDDAPERDEEAVAATPAPPAAPPRPDAPPPAPLFAGTYAVYDDGAEGLFLVVATREGEEHRKHLPARMIKMAEMMMGGNSPLAAMFGGR